MSPATSASTSRRPLGASARRSPARNSAASFARVTLRLTDGREYREWPAWVGFVTGPLHKSVLGYAGCLQFFDATFFGEDEVAELLANSLYPGV